MNAKNNNNGTEKTVEGFTITEKPVELNKKEFFKLLAKSEEGLVLNIEKVGKIFKSKYDSTKVGCFVDYTFSKDSNNYEIGIYYNLAKPIKVEHDSEGKPIYTVTITEDMNLFKILAVAVDLSKAKDLTGNEKLIQDTLTGVTFKAEIGTSYNGGFLIEPISLID